MVEMGLSGSVRYIYRNTYTYWGVAWACAFNIRLCACHRTERQTSLLALLRCLVVPDAKGFSGTSCI